jgi:uncharacterized membrane protein (TIGR02234 family)
VTDRLTSKGTVLILVLVAGSTTLISGSRQWASGTVNDVVLGSGTLHGTGSDIAPGVMAAALVGLASMVVAATSGRLPRIVAGWATVLAAVLGVTVIISVLSNPDTALSRLAQAGTGRNGAPGVQGQVGGWAWVALAAMLVMGLGGVAALARGSHWSGLSSRYDAGEGRPKAPGPRSAPGGADEQITGSSTDPTSAWDQLSRGDDPTL